jgi:hypothetical protein
MTIYIFVDLVNDL